MIYNLIGDKTIMKIVNFFMKTIIRSPLHGIISKGILLITYLGWKSGNFYTVPVQYVQDGDTVWLSSTKDRVWWRNMVGGAAVTLRLQGKDVKGKADAYEDDRKVEDGLTAIFKADPNFAKYFKVSLDENGQPNPAELAETVKTNVVVEIKLSE